MDNEHLYDVFVGANTGAFKHHISGRTVTLDLIDLKTIQKHDEILHLSWTTEEQNKILIAQLNGVVKTFDLATRTFTEHNKIKIQNDKIVGIGQRGAQIITGIESGLVQIWSKKSAMDINVGSPLDVMRLNPFSTNTLATGGKENQLKLWDFSTKQDIFTAKNVPNDSLQLRVPVWVSDVVFLAENHVATASRFSNVCFYDTRMQRRPVTRLECANTTYACLATTYQSNVVAVGGGKGILHLIDLRKPGKILHKYKGFIGAVKNIQCSQHQPIMFSVSLDRRLRTHNLETTQLLEEVYLKSRLNCLLVKPIEIKKESNELVHEKTNDVSVISTDYSCTEDPGDILYENSRIYEDEEPCEEIDGNEVEVIKTKKRKISNSKIKKKRKC